MSHVSGKVCKTVIDIIESKLEGKFTRNTGDEHTFLGMDISFLGDGKVAIATPQHIQEALDDSGENLNGNVVNPALSKLFKVRKEEKLLTSDEAEKFHSIVAKLLWIMQRSRPDLETDVAIICTRVKKSSE